MSNDIKDEETSIVEQPKCLLNVLALDNCRIMAHDGNAFRKDINDKMIDTSAFRFELN